MVDSQVPQENGLLERAREMVSPDKLAEKLNISRNRLLDLGLYLVVGFITGFLLKKYSKYVFAIMLVILGLIVLHNLNVLVLDVNWHRVQELFGIQPVSIGEGTNLFAPYWEWIQLNFGLVLSFTIGFLIGIKLG